MSSERTVRASLQAWEALRIVYNAGLLIALLGVPWLAGRAMPHWLAVCLFLVMANVCFFTGPVAEVYSRALGYRWSSAVRSSVFGAGLALSVLGVMWLF